jgi:hypothetical protein
MAELLPGAAIKNRHSMTPGDCKQVASLQGLGLDLCPHQLGPAQIGAAESGLAQVGAEHAGPCQIGLTEVRVA